MKYYLMKCKEPDINGRSEIINKVELTEEDLENLIMATAHPCEESEEKTHDKILEVYK